MKVSASSSRLWPGDQGQAGVSLARQLLLWLLVPQLVVWLAGGMASYRLASGYVDQAIDESLLQASKALARQLKPIGSGLLIDFPKAAQDILEADPSDRLLYTVSSPPGQFILGNQSLPTPEGLEALPLGQAHFYNAHFPGPNPSTAPSQALRIVAVRLALGVMTVPSDPPPVMLVQVARSSANREELARRILVDMLLPMSGLVVLLTLLVWAGIRAGLAPLHRLRLQVEGRAPTDLAPLQLASAPRELWSLASALNTLLAAVQSNVNTQKRFIGDAAHQLRTPLAGLKSQTEIALQSVTDPALQARLQRVHESATRSAHLVNQLLTLARAEPESLMAQDRRRFDLHHMARQLTAEWVPRALRAKVDLGMDEEAEASAVPVWVEGNELLIREAVTNLIDNALQYAGAGAQVTVQVLPQGAMALLTVTDSGPGIAEADRERVMERFVRGTETGNGCGLGLAIVREIIERHRGSVSLGSVSPQGLQVTLALPLAA
jgi:two-component system sensor histidine kinase TctE